MERTISGMLGKGSVTHNTRAFSAKNVDRERSQDNVQFCHSNIKEVYHQLFDEALERYNSKQKRSDRRIDNYYEKIRRGKQEKLFHEVIFQIGNKDDMNVKSSEGQIAKKVLSEFMEQFQQRNSNLHVFSAHLHMDEETPHLHIDFVPYIRNSKRGLDTRVSLKGALAEQGFKGGTRGATEWNQWIEAEKQELSRVMERYDIQWKQLGTHNKHLSVLDFEKQERQKEVKQLEQIISGNKSELSGVISEKVKAEQMIKQIKQESKAVRQEIAGLSETNTLLKDQASTLTTEKRKLQLENKKLEQKQEKLQQEIEKMANSKMVMERNIHTYDEDKEWQLPEPGALMSAKAYRDKKAVSLVEKLKERVKNLTIKCVHLMEEVKRLTDKVKKQEYQISHMTDKLIEQDGAIEKLQDKAADLGRLERLIGKEKVQTVLEQAKELEWAEKSYKHPKRTSEMSR